MQGQNISSKKCFFIFFHGALGTPRARQAPQGGVFSKPRCYWCSFLAGAKHSYKSNIFPICWSEIVRKKNEIEGVGSPWRDSRRNSAPGPGPQVPNGATATHLVTKRCDLGSLGVPGPASTPLGRRGRATSSIDPKLDLDLDISDLGFDQISSYKRGGSTTTHVSTGELCPPARPPKTGGPRPPDSPMGPRALRAHRFFGLGPREALGALCPTGGLRKLDGLDQ